MYRSLAKALTGGQHLFLYKNKDSLQHLSHPCHSGSTPLVQQTEPIGPSAISHSLFIWGELYNTIRAALGETPLVSGQERRESDQLYSSRVKREKMFPQ